MKYSEDEPLMVAKFKYELTPEFREFFKAEIIKSFGEQAWKKTEQMIKEAERKEH